MITRSLKSLWQSDVLLGASVGAATSGLLVVLALVVAPLLDSSSKRSAADARTGTANLPAPARAAESHGTDDDRAAKRDRAAVTRRADAASLPAPARDDQPRRTVDAPERQPTPIPVSPATTITKVPIVPGLSAPSTGASSPAGAAPSIAPAAPRTGLRLRVRAASFGGASGEPELRLTMGISGQTGTATLPEQVTVTLRPDIPSNTEQDATPLALNADVDVIDQAQAESPSQGDAAPAAMGLRVRMSLVPATAEVATLDEGTQGDGNSNVVKLAIPLTVFNEAEDTSIPGVPTEIPTDAVPADGTPAEPAPSEPAPSEPAPPEPAPSEPATPAPAPSEPAPSEPAPSEPAPPEPSTITVQEIHVPLLITLEPVTTVENTTLPLPSDIPADTMPPEGLRVTISVQNALNEVAPEAPASPSSDPGATDPAPDGGAVALAGTDGAAGYDPAAQ